MQILHISLTLQGSDYVSLRYFRDNQNDYQEKRLPLAEIKGLNNKAETDYYTRSPVEYAKTGQALYNWLDTNDRILANNIKLHHKEGLIIAIATDEGLAHLPWELLHDGHTFLVEKQPPIIPVRWVSPSKPIEIINKPQNRPLNVLFMATSPLDVQPELDYEAEEGHILTATQRIPLNLRVEESGCLTELDDLVREYEENYFYIFHLTGHATHQDEKPYFLTEDEYGGLVYSNTSAIATALRSPLPPLIFLSGCRTGYGSDGVLPSMAEELLNLGGTAVLGWGQNVRDTDATAAASHLYRELSQGETVASAIASTYQDLIQQNALDWHKLRLYVGNSLPQALVTPLRTKGRKQLPKPTTTIEFRDDEKRLRVASREEFVGRRRQLQNCLRTFKTDFEKVGVLIHGMGGWGKSSIASRLWDRLPEHEKILFWRQIDESSLINKLSSKLIKPELREIRNILQANDDSLEVKLSYLFSQLAELGEKPFLLILDDFEWNLEPRDGGYILKPEVVPILEALVRSIQETGTENKIIITCRYDFDSDLLEYFYKQGLEAFRKTELTKKLNRLKNFNSDKISEDVRERALILADGNPRLLDFLNNEVLGKEDPETKLTELEQSPELWKDKIIWEELYQLIDEPLQQILSHCLVYEIPVPMSALEVVCESFSDYKQQLQRGLDLGLIEVSSEPKEEDRVYLISRILPHVIANIKLPEAPDVYCLYRKAYEKLNKLWENTTNRSEEQWQEIFRLLFADHENKDRFRGGFHHMLAVPYEHCSNRAADRALETELKKTTIEHTKTNILDKLEKLLQQEQWKAADEETAWIFYQFTVLLGKRKVYTLRNNFPCEEVKRIDQLWVKYSDGKFGFSVQKKIWENLGGTMFDAEYGDEKKIITLLTNSRALKIWTYRIRFNKIFQKAIAENRELNVSEIKQKLMEIFHEEETIENDRDMYSIRRLLASELFIEFEKRVHWDQRFIKKLINCLILDISKEEAMKGQFPVRCFTQDLYNRGYDNDRVRHHQLFWGFEEFWSTLDGGNGAMYLVDEKMIKAKRVWVENEWICIRLEDDREIRFPAYKNKRLAKATPQQLAEVELICEGTGLHWETLDEDLSVIGILEGRLGN